MANSLTKLRYRHVPDHLFGEVLSKPWIDNAVPFIALIATLGTFMALQPSMFSAYGLVDLSRQLAEFGLLVVALTVVMISGGIDLAIGSIFALCILTIMTCLNVLGWPLGTSVLATAGVGAFCGAINGVLIGFLRLRAFLTTLVTLIIFRSIYELIFPQLGTAIVMGMSDSAIWDALSFNTFLGLPYAIWIAGIIMLGVHVVLSRSRFGWQLSAVGGGRRSAFNAGIKVRTVVFLAYVSSGVLTGLAAVLYGARMNSVGSDTGVGLELGVVTAAIMGGVTLGGGRGSVSKALMGAIVVLIVQNGLLLRGVQGPTAAMILGLILLLAAFLDVRWVKNRHKLLQSSYISPTWFELGKRPQVGPGSPFEINDKLKDVEVIGLGEIEGPEDVVLDADGNLYAGNRFGDVIKFHGPDHKTWEVYAHTGGHFLGCNFDRHGNLIGCVGGMGLYMVTPEREVVKLTDETPRNPLSIIDDSHLRLPDDMDIAPDGRIFFSEATVRYGMDSWAQDAIESRGNGRLICYDPKTKTTKTVLRNRIFPNGIVCLKDGESLLFNETWACRISRYYYDGPKKGTVEPVCENLPGYPDNINRASDGNYWVALFGMRTPLLDMAMTEPAWRRRMTLRVSPANYLYANINVGCVIKIDEKGEVLDTIWDAEGRNHSSITSMREHKGYLYLGGVHNNRIGKYRIPGADPDWTAMKDYWGNA